jgi:hypothetical protein
VFFDHLRLRPRPWSIFWRFPDVNRLLWRLVDNGGAFRRCCGGIALLVLAYRRAAVRKSFALGLSRCSNTTISCVTMPPRTAPRNRPHRHRHVVGVRHRCASIWRKAFVGHQNSI